MPSLDLTDDEFGAVVELLQRSIGEGKLSPRLSCLRSVVAKMVPERPTSQPPLGEPAYQALPPTPEPGQETSSGSAKRERSVMRKEAMPPIGDDTAPSRPSR
jgi:hypothetical protein